MSQARAPTSQGLFPSNILRRRGRRQRFWIQAADEFRYVSCKSIRDCSAAARVSWKIENAIFITLRNQVCSPGHDYGRVKKGLCFVRMLLVLLVFSVDQIQPYCCRAFRPANAGDGRTAPSRRNRADSACRFLPKHLGKV